MDQILNLARYPILIKDLTDIIDCDSVRKNVSQLKLIENLENNITEEKDMCKIPEFAQLREALKNESVDYLRNFWMDDPTHSFEDLQITESWANQSIKGESHHLHMHPFSVVSGVMFLNDTPDNLNLTFENEASSVPYWRSGVRRDYHQLSNIIDNDNETNLKNHIVLFLSTTGHLVAPVQGDTPRVTISWNTFWKGRVGNINSMGSEWGRNINADIVDNIGNYSSPLGRHVVFK